MLMMLDDIRNGVTHGGSTSELVRFFTTATTKVLKAAAGRFVCAAMS